jgi:hypothetical protein
MMGRGREGSAGAFVEAGGRGGSGGAGDDVEERGKVGVVGEKSMRLVDELVNPFVFNDSALANRPRDISDASTAAPLPNTTSPSSSSSSCCSSREA